MKKFFVMLVMTSITVLASANIDPPKVEIPTVDIYFAEQESTIITMPGELHTYEVQNVMQYETTIWLSWSGGTMPGDIQVAYSFSIVNQQTSVELRDDLYRCCKYDYIYSSDIPISLSLTNLLDLLVPPDPGDRGWSAVT